MTELHTPASVDLIDALAQLDRFPAVKAIRHQRGKVVDATQGSYDRLFDPALPGLTLGERLQALRAAGLSHQEILDALHAAAIFAWANRLMLNLGEAVHP